VLVADVGSGADADRIVADVVQQHGRIDVLINNAGVIQAGPVDRMSLADFDEAMAVHFWGAVTDHAGSDSAHAAPGRGPHCERLVYWRQGGRTAPGAVLCEQVRADRAVDSDARGTPSRQHPDYNRKPGPDADRFAIQRPLQG